MYWPPCSSGFLDILDHMETWRKVVKVYPVQYLALELNIADITTKGKAVFVWQRMGALPEERVIQ